MMNPLYWAPSKQTAIVNINNVHSLEQPTNATAIRQSAVPQWAWHREMKTRYEVDITQDPEMIELNHN